MGHAAQARAEPAVGGAVAVTNEAVAHVVGLTVLECYGVVGMAATSLTQGVARRHAGPSTLPTNASAGSVTLFQ